jgi:hypothetical protein
MQETGRPLMKAKTEACSVKPARFPVFESLHAGLCRMGVGAFEGADVTVPFRLSRRRRVVAAAAWSGPASALHRRVAWRRLERSAGGAGNRLVSKDLNTHWPPQALAARQPRTPGSMGPQQGRSRSEACHRLWTSVDCLMCIAFRLWLEVEGPRPPEDSIGRPDGPVNRMAS